MPQDYTQGSTNGPGAKPHVKCEVCLAAPTQAYIEKRMDEQVFSNLGVPGSRFYREVFADQVRDIKGITQDGVSKQGLPSIA